MSTGTGPWRSTGDEAPVRRRAHLAHPRGTLGAGPLVGLLCGIARAEAAITGDVRTALTSTTRGGGGQANRAAALRGPRSGNSGPPAGVGRTMTSPSLSAAAPTDTDNPHHEVRWLILGVLGLAQLMVILDGTIVNIALPSAQHALGFSDADRQWVITAYALAFGSLLLLGGRMSDLFGRKRAFIVGLIGFAGASALGGAATGFPMLVSARALQGAFGALLAPAALSLLTTTFVEPGERAKAFGVYGAIAGAGGAIGLLLGGILTQYASWRWCLFVNLIFAALAVTGASLWLRHQAAPNRSPLDIPGTGWPWPASLPSSSGCPTPPPRPGATRSQWPSWSAGLVLALFVLVETRVAHPLLPLAVAVTATGAGPTWPCSSWEPGCSGCSCSSPTTCRQR